MDREQYIGCIKRMLKTVDGREFVYNFFLDSCGVDISAKIPVPPKDEYNAGLKKPAIDFLNILVYDCREELDLIINDQSRRAAIKENYND